MSLLFNLLRAITPNFIVEKLKQRFHVPDMNWSLRNLQNNGFKPKFIVDIGAYQGEWTLMTKQIFTEAKFLMIEAQDEKRNFLDGIKANDIDYEICLLGPNESSKAKFFVNETVSSALEETAKENQEFIEIPMFTLDEVLNKRNTSSPDFIKLDVQGFELEVLKGASNALKNAEVVLMEVSLLEINKNAPLIYDVMKFMNEHEFVCHDICSIIRRPLDKALWQTDLIFVKKDSNLVASKKYQ